MKHFGKFNITVQREDGTVEETGYVDNLFLNNYFALSDSTRGFSSIYCLFGTGSTPPTVNDTSLENFVTGASIKSYTNASNDLSGNLFEKSYDEATKTFTSSWTVKFNASKGAIIGNMSEIGISYARDDSKLFTRSLIKDAQGNPTTISLGANDVVSVTYIIGYTMDFTTSLLESRVININGQDTTVELHALCYNMDTWTGRDTTWKPISSTAVRNSQINWTCYDTWNLGYIHVISGAIDNYEKGTLAPGSSVLTYVGGFSDRALNKADGTYIVKGTPKITISAGKANGTWNVMTFSLYNDEPGKPNSSATAAITFDPPLIKGPNDEFVFNSIKFKCGRT